MFYELRNLAFVSAGVLLAIPPLMAQSAAGKVFEHAPTGSFSGGFCPQGSTSLCIPLDGSFTPVNMNEPGGSGPADPTDFCQRNDDDSGHIVLNGWSFSHFGTPYGDVYVNNNGNLSFGVSFPDYVPTGFPVNGYPMVAPFWADVDTGDILDTFGGVVWARQESIANGDAVNRLTVIWDHVGYYNEHGDLLNTFEVVISDGLVAEMGIGNNVCFCYDDMQWTTGDASGGVGGFGGAPATVGANLGNGIDFFQVGLFDHPGTDSDGPGGNTDGVSFLDGQAICFNISGTEPNVPPIYLTPPTGCLHVGCYETLTFTIQAIGPELGQTVDFAVNTGGLANFTYTVTPGNPGTVACSFSPVPGQGGAHVITFTATDDGVPALSTDLNVCLTADDCDAATPLCFGDGSGAPCGCGNEANAGSMTGCLNGLGVGAVLSSSGSTSVSANDLVLTASGVTNQPGLFCQGINILNGGGGVTYGDGLRCCGGAMIRLQIVDPPGPTQPTSISTSISIANHLPSGTVQPGDTKCYQYWYRDPFGSPCGSTFNFSSALRIYWFN